LHFFARFKANCEVTPLRSFANLEMSRHRKEFRGALGHGLYVKPSLGAGVKMVEPLKIVLNIPSGLTQFCVNHVNIG